MDESWKQLIELGVPDGPAHRRAPVRWERSRVKDLVAASCRSLSAVEDRRRVPLVAWLRAWEHHWPTEFRNTLGPRGAQMLADLTRQPMDLNRYLKLRRIAVENLSRIL